MAAFLDACRFLPTAGGTTDWTYSSAVGGYQSPSAAGVVNGRTYKYRAESADLTQWEIGEGTYNTGTGVLTRTTVLYNSSGTTSKINFSAAPNVAIVALSPDLTQVYGQCRLTLSGGNLLLSPRNGNFLTINGQVCIIPDAGVTLSASGLSVGTTYLIYAYLNSGTMTLEASSTSHATSTTAGNKGVEIKSADDTRTLVGMARVITGPAWQDTAAQRFVRTWFNRTRLSVAGANDTTSTETNVGTYIEKTVSKAEFVCFADDAVLAGAYGMATNTTSAYTGLQVFIDGVGVGVGLDWNIGGAGNRTVYNPLWPATVSDGYHYVSFALRTVGGGTVSVATYQGMVAIAAVG